MTAQHLQALSRANRVRTERNLLKTEIRNLRAADGARLVADMIDQPTDVIAGMSTLKLLTSIRFMGVHKAGTCLLAADLKNFDKPIGELTRRQRSVIVGQLVIWARQRHA